MSKRKLVFTWWRGGYDGGNIVCPECAAWPHVKTEGCPMCLGFKTIQDRRAATPSDLAVERLLGAINTIMGVGEGFRERSQGDPAYWWRDQLYIDAGLDWDGEKYIIREGSTK